MEQPIIDRVRSKRLFTQLAFRIKCYYVVHESYENKKYRSLYKIRRKYLK